MNALVSDRASAMLSENDQAILAYAVKLTRSPGTISSQDIQNLRSHGFNDLGIHDICAITAYFGFVNRIADGLGVELEPRFKPD